MTTQNEFKNCYSVNSDDYIRRLREALTPLAAILEIWSCDRTKEEFDAIPDSQTLDGAGDTNLTLGDVRRAVAVLKGGAR
jgi:hypothetical protein